MDIKDKVYYPFQAFNKEWALLTPGESAEDFNTMTISWGGMGTLWSLPVATVYVKPCRYTHTFMEKYTHFTISFFDEQYRRDLELLGSKSGRDGDKVGLTSLVPKVDEEDRFVSFEQAKVVLFCKRLYRQDLDLSAIPDQMVMKHYRTEAPHTMYIGEVTKIYFQQ